jgi:hypothetical protein
VLVGRRGALALDAVAREAPIGAEAAA